MNTSAPRATISPTRQRLYYGGMGLTIIGVLLFLSVFIAAVSGPAKPRPVVWVSPGTEQDYSQFCGVLKMPCDAEVRVGQPGSPAAPTRSNSPSDSLFGRAFAGLALVVVGGVMMSLGRAGLRGSGVILDPEGARQDLKPWSQAAGGMLDDALENSALARGVLAGGAVERADDQPREVVRVRCRQCRALNEEDAKFCDNCGAAL